jgi:hypothetical protein
MSEELVKELCTEFEMSGDMIEESVTKWRQTSIKSGFNWTSKQTKTILSAVCVYVTLLQENRPFTITQVCHRIGCNAYEFGKVYTQVIKDFPLYKTFESIPIERLVGVTLSEANFHEEEREALNQRVIDIINIERECWLIEGRSPIHIIFGAAYLAWKSLKPNLRSKVKLTQFCNIVCIDYKHTTSERVTEAFNALKRLASKLPGKEKFKFTKQNIAIYIDDILQYRTSLLYDLNQQMKCKNKNDDQNSLAKSIDWVNAFKRKTYGSKRQEEEQTQYQDVVNKTGSDEEISDTEIDSYIRDKKEVKLIKRLKKMCDNDEEEYFRIVSEMSRTD